LNFATSAAFIEQIEKKKDITEFKRERLNKENRQLIAVGTKAMKDMAETCELAKVLLKKLELD
jgi:hypothetical protein